jgi:hypothetical protein
MRTHYYLALTAFAAMTSVMACGSQDASPSTGGTTDERPAEPTSPELSLEQLPPGPDGTIRVRLMYGRGADQPGPRVAEVVLSVSGPLQYVSHEAGLCIGKADKNLYVQPKDGTLRTVVISSGNLNRLDPGMIALYEFRKTGQGTAKLAIRAERAVFAPADASHGLHIAPPLEFDVK